MAFERYVPKREMLGRRASGVSVYVSGRQGNICLGRDVHSALGWMSGDRVTLLVGSGEHAGMLALRRDPKGTHKICRTGPRGAKLKISCQPIKAHFGGPTKTTRVEHFIDSGTLFITLPKPASVACPKTTGLVRAV